MEDGGGYYRFHVFWYGSDSDGRVESFVWALTDTSVQDEDTTDDEEDVRFNPALDASTLEIGSWTTKTDSIFNFTIDQGVSPSYDMTLHMVAMDDLGDFDRTPARLHFWSNTLGNPVIQFYRDYGDSLVAVPQGQADTVGFGVPYKVHWEGVTPNIRGYSAEALALVDTVPDYRDMLGSGGEVPMGDGMLGFKYRILGDLGGNCVPSITECWSPKKFNEATGDSYSVFVLTDENGVPMPAIQDLAFENRDPDENAGVFEKLLPSGAVNFEVNSVDVAGVEVATFLRPFTFLVNFDPETIILDGEADWAHPEDPEIYPYYILLDGDPDEHFPFKSGDRIPDRTYVVVKALARDDPRDSKLENSEFEIGISGFLQGTRDNYFGGTFSFNSESSELNTTPEWGAECESCWYADTLGFLTGPRTEFTINMQSVDVHGRKDGSPAKLSFDVGYPPCVQCVEILPKSFIPSDYDESLICVEDTLNIAAHPCFGDTTVLRVNKDSDLADDELQFVQQAFILVDKSTYFTRVVLDADQGGDRNYEIAARLYRMEILLHGLDDPRERWERKDRRMMGWSYQVDYECDPFNQIRDGGGNDDLKEATWGIDSNKPGLAIDPATGLWKISVDVAVPTDLMSLGPDVYRDISLRFIAGIEDPDARDAAFDATTKQFSKGRVQAIALDQTQCSFGPTRPARYNFFRYVRPSVRELPAGKSWRDCDLKSGNVVPDIQLDLDISPGAMESLEGAPVSQYFRLVVQTATGDFECYGSEGY